MSLKREPRKATKSRGKSASKTKPRDVAEPPACALTDLSERRSLKDALEQSEMRFALFMEHMPAAAFLKDLNGRYVYFSPSFADFASRAPEPRLGTSDEEN